jgi:hypothetical protein
LPEILAQDDKKLMAEALHTCVTEGVQLTLNVRFALSAKRLIQVQCFVEKDPGNESMILVGLLQAWHPERCRTSDKEKSAMHSNNQFIMISSRADSPAPSMSSVSSDMDKVTSAISQGTTVAPSSTFSIGCLSANAQADDVDQCNDMPASGWKEPSLQEKIARYWEQKEQTRSDDGSGHVRRSVLL